MQRPKVIAHNVASLDGRLTLGPGQLLLHGDPRWFDLAGSSEDAYAAIRALHQPQVIIEGSGSLVVEGVVPGTLPPLACDPEPLYHDYLPAAVVDSPGHRGWLAIVDSRGRVRWMYKEWPSDEWAGWHILVLVSRRTPPEYLAYLQAETIPYLVVGDDRVDLATAIDKLGSVMGAQTIVSTGGGQLNGALLRAGLLDEVSVDLFPALIGGIGTPSLFDSPPLGPNERPTPLKLIHAQLKPDGRLWVRYEVIR